VTCDDVPVEVLELCGDLGEMEVVHPEDFSAVAFGNPVSVYLVLPPNAGHLNAWRCGSLHLAFPAVDPTQELTFEELMSRPHGGMVRVASIRCRGGRVRVDLGRTA
jgi:hypothetical protein